MSGETGRKEWAIDYHDGDGPQHVPDEASGRAWVKHWNLHRLEGKAAATLLWRWVKYTPWLVTLTSPEDPALVNGYPEEQR